MPPPPEPNSKRDQNVVEQMEAPAQDWKPTTQKSSSQLVMIASVFMLGGATALAIVFCLNYTSSSRMTQV